MTSAAGQSKRAATSTRMLNGLSEARRGASIAGGVVREHNTPRATCLTGTPSRLRKENIVHRTTLTLTAMALLALAAPTFATEQGYYRFPAIHGDRIVFAAEEDLWQVGIDGGRAVRLTTHAGAEAFPKFSPDGRWLAFSAEYGGNVDVYVMPGAGGVPQRLTYHPDADEVLGWLPDSSAVAFRSRRASASRDYLLYTVPVEGGLPTEVPIGPTALVAYAPDGHQIALCQHSREFRTWKRYLGGRAQDIWVGDLETGEFAQLTDWEGTDRFPMWYEGRIYYLSDRGGRLNIYSAMPDGSDLQQHTDHEEYDARWPDLQDGRIVYMYGGELWLLDLATGETGAVSIELPSDRVQWLPRFENAARTFESYDLDFNGERVVVSSRGEIWVRPVEPGRTISLCQTSGVRERLPAFGPDGERIAAITDETGEQELVLFDAAGKAPRRILTDRDKGWLFGPVWSPDGKHLAYSDLTMNLFLVDAETGETTHVDGNDIWEIYQYVFSPDGKWLAYTMNVQEEVLSLFLYDIENRQRHVITTDFTNDHSPVWDPQGRFLYFLSERTLNPLLGQRDFEFIVDNATRPYVLILREDGVSPFLPKELQPKEGDDKQDEEEEKPEELMTPEEKAEKEAEEAAAPKPARELPKMRIDVEGLGDRVVEVPVAPGDYSQLRATEDKLFYMASPNRGLREGVAYGDKWRRHTQLIAFDIEEKTAEVFIHKLSSYTLSGDGKRIAYRDDGDIIVGKTSYSPERARAEDLDRIKLAELPLRVVPAEEWRQIFHEAWRLQRDFYWAENMAGTDWTAERERYARLLPRIASRAELNDLIGQMIGELGTSHTYIWGGDARGAAGVSVGLLGADLAPDAAVGALRFTRILRPEKWDHDAEAPLTMSHADVQAGEYLFAINGHPVDEHTNIHDRLAGLAGDQVQLTVGTLPDQSDARDIQIEALGNDNTLRYYDWCRRNREYVLEQTDGQAGYFHIPDMGGRGLVQFIKGFYPQIERDGLIIDIRNNGGGFVSQLIIQRLAREAWAYGKPRRGPVYTYPARVHRGPKAVIMDENAGSDGDIFPESFRIKGLGPLIGMRTWGGVIGIRADKRFIDGGLSTQPEFSWWEPRRKYGLENRGVDPDIEVPYTPADYLAGRDPQLDRTIEEILKLIAEQPPAEVSLEEIPDKSLRNMQRRIEPQP